MVFKSISNYQILVELTGALQWGLQCGRSTQFPVPLFRDEIEAALDCYGIPASSQTARERCAPGAASTGITTWAYGASPQNPRSFMCHRLDRTTSTMGYLLLSRRSNLPCSMPMMETRFCWLPGRTRAVQIALRLKESFTARQRADAITTSTTWGRRLPLMAGDTRR